MFKILDIIMWNSLIATPFAIIFYAVAHILGLLKTRKQAGFKETYIKFHIIALVYVLLFSVGLHPILCLLIIGITYKILFRTSIFEALLESFVLCILVAIISILLLLVVTGIFFNMEKYS